MPPGMIKPPMIPVPRPRNERPGMYPDEILGGIGNALSRNSNALIALGTGLMSRPRLSEAMAAAGQGWMQGSQLDQQNAMLAQEQSDKNATTEWLKQHYPQYASLPVAQGWQAALKEMADKTAAGTGHPANIREWEVFSTLSPEDQAKYLRMKRANPYLDIGTGFVQPDPLNPGNISGPEIVKDNFTPAYDTASGTQRGKADSEVQVDFDSLNSKLPGLKTVVAELGELAKTATYTVTGQVIDTAMREAGMEPSENAVARAKYIAMVDNQILPLLRDTFGAAFTAREGDTLRATLGDPNKSPAEKQVILEAFIEQKIRDLAALKTRLPGNGGGTRKTFVYNETTGELE